MKSEDLRKFDDIHTHLHAGPHAVCSLPPCEAIVLSRTGENQPYSIELHPWKASPSLLEEFLNACDVCRDDPRFVAVGEIGLDRLCATPFETQKLCFGQALQKAGELRKPVILHVVKAWDEMMQMVKEAGVVEHKIIHGFRKNAALARQLVAQGFCISIGEKFNAEILSEIPAEKLFRETDNIN